MRELACAKVFRVIVLAAALDARASSFQTSISSSAFVCRRIGKEIRTSFCEPTILFSSSGDNKDDSSSSKVVDAAAAAAAAVSESNDSSEEETDGSAATNTINERLMAELKEATGQEKGTKSSVGKKLGFDAFRSDKTDEEREAAIAEARDLNGVNPGVALAGSAFALAAAAGLWALTGYLAEYFVLHPVESDTFVVERAAAVMRNVVMGIVALASGFFGVTGLGIFLLGVRVAYGVFTGELDPTPIKKSKQDEIEMPNVWDLMLNKKPGRRR